MAENIFYNHSVAEREILFITLYKKAFPAVVKYVSKGGGSFDDAKDVFQDALVIYYEKSTGPAFVMPVNEVSYLLGIARNLWLQKFREGVRHAAIDGFDEHFDLMEEDVHHPSTERIMQYLETAGKKCMELLRSFYYDNLPVSAIAGLFGYSGVRSATVQKYKCMEKVRETIKERSLAYEDFVE